MTIKSGPEWMETLSWAWYDLLLKQCRIRDTPEPLKKKAQLAAQPPPKPVPPPLWLSGQLPANQRCRGANGQQRGPQQGGQGGQGQLSEQKQNVLVWSAFYRNESKTYWFGPKNFFIASRSFPFWAKISGTKQSNLIWSGNCFRQSRTFLFNPKTNRSKQKVLIWFPYYCDKSKIFWFGLLVLRIEAKYFDS